MGIVFMVDGIKDECYGILYGYRGVDSYALILFSISISIITMKRL